MVGGNLKRLWWFFLFLAVFLPVAGRAIAGLNPPPKVLIIIGNCTPGSEDSYGNTMVTRVRSAMNALTPPPAQFDFVTVPCTTGSAPGIYSSLGTKKLTDYCQVWDLRVIGGGSALGTLDWTSFSLTGATSDKKLYEDFLRSGGSLYILADNNTLHDRNDNLISMLNSWSTGGSIPYPSQFGGGDFWFSTFSPLPLPFQGNPNTLASRYTKWPGYVLLGRTGSGRPVTTQDSGTGDGKGNPSGTILVSQFVFLPQDTKLGAGRILVDLDWTSFASAWSTSPASMTAWVQNAYTWLGNCYYRFSIDKAASVVPPASVCIGDTFNYILCLHNTGANPLSPTTLIEDTLPTCVSAQSSTPAWSTKTGSYVNWLAGSVPVGAQFCVTLTVRADYFPPCP